MCCLWTDLRSSRKRNGQHNCVRSGGYVTTAGSLCFEKADRGHLWTQQIGCLYNQIRDQQSQQKAWLCGCRGEVRLEQETGRTRTREETVPKPEAEGILGEGPPLHLALHSTLVQTYVLFGRNIQERKFKPSSAFPEKDAEKTRTSIANPNLLEANTVQPSLP